MVDSDDEDSSFASDALFSQEPASDFHPSDDDIEIDNEFQFDDELSDSIKTEAGGQDFQDDNHRKAHTADEDYDSDDMARLKKSYFNAYKNDFDEEQYRTDNPYDDNSDIPATPVSLQQFTPAWAGAVLRKWFEKSDISPESVRIPLVEPHINGEQVGPDLFSLFITKFEQYTCLL